MDEDRLLREFYPDATVDRHRKRNTLRAAMLLSYVPKFQLLPGNRGTFLRFTVPPFLQEVVDPPLPEVIDLRMYGFDDGAYWFKRSINRRTFTSNEESWFRKMWSRNMHPQNAADLFDPTFFLAYNKKLRYSGAANTKPNGSVTSFGHYKTHGFRILIKVSSSKNVEIEVALGEMRKPQDYTVLLPWPIKNLLSELHELPPIPATINGAPQSSPADQRAQIMGIAEEKYEMDRLQPRKVQR